MSKLDIGHHRQLKVARGGSISENKNQEAEISLMKVRVKYPEYQGEMKKFV